MCVDTPELAIIILCCILFGLPNFKNMCINNALPVPESKKE